MQVKSIMNTNVIPINREESVEVAARLLSAYNVGVLPVCNRDGTLCGMVTDRDLVIRCMAAGKKPEKTKVEQVMTGRVVSVKPDMDAAVAAHLMGREQVRRLPVTENGRLCGMLGLSDLAGREENIMDAADALADITSNISSSF